VNYPEGDFPGVFYYSEVVVFLAVAAVLWHFKVAPFSQPGFATTSGYLWSTRGKVVSLMCLIMWQGQKICTLHRTPCTPARCLLFQMIQLKFCACGHLTLSKICCQILCLFWPGSNMKPNLCPQKTIIWFRIFACFVLYPLSSIDMQIFV